MSNLGGKSVVEIIEMYNSTILKNRELRKRLHRKISEGYKLKATKKYILDYMLYAELVKGSYTNTKEQSLYDFWCWVSKKQ